MATELAKAYVQIIPSAKGIKNSLKKPLDEEADKSGTSAGTLLGGKLKAVLASAGLGVALKSAILEGGKLEQSLGGIETLYKGSADKMINYAKQAYKTSGVSANEYMEQVTSFSAGLIASLGGDTNKAAKAADTAMRDMSDNANKFGTDIGSIQMAYQGFAKQNYTMLDNLKLGYGGTKTEMQRLLADAEKISGVHYDMSNLADVYSAIHTIQEEMGVTGTTAKEASTTLAGSFGSMKAAAKDFAGNLTLGRDVDNSLKNLINSTGTFLSNLLPALGRIVQGIVNSLGGTFPALFDSIGKKMSKSAPQLINKGLDIVTKFSANLRKNAGKFISSGTEMLVKLAEGIAKSMPALMRKMPVIISNLAGVINDNAPKLLVAGVKIIVTLGKGIIKAVPALIANLPAITKAIFDVFMAFNWVSIGKNIITFIKNAFSTGKTVLPNVAKTIGTRIVNALKNLPGNLGRLALSAVRRIRTSFSSIDWWGVGSRVVSGIVGAITSLPGRLFSLAKSAGSRMMSAFKSISWSSVGRSIINGIVSGITGAAGSLFNALGDLASSALQHAKKKLKINSPSKAFRDEVGSAIPEGIALGITENGGYITDALEETTAKMVKPFNPSIAQLKEMSDFGNNGYLDTKFIVNNVNQTINIYQPVKTPSETANEIKRQAMLIGLAGGNI